MADNVCVCVCVCVTFTSNSVELRLSPPPESLTARTDRIRHRRTPTGASVDAAGRPPGGVRVGVHHKGTEKDAMMCHQSITRRAKVELKHAPFASHTSPS